MVVIVNLVSVKLFINDRRSMKNTIISLGYRFLDDAIIASGHFLSVLVSFLTHIDMRVYEHF